LPAELEVLLARGTASTESGLGVGAIGIAVGGAVDGDELSKGIAAASTRPRWRGLARYARYRQHRPQ
jgi:hypothetical protein